jgi:Hypoxia induced protein conserved region
MRALMQTFLYHSTTIAVVAVFVVLLFGLYTMMRGTSPNLSQKIMRWRVGLQFVALIIIMAAVYAKKHFV